MKSTFLRRVTPQLKAAAKRIAIATALAVVPLIIQEVNSAKVDPQYAIYILIASRLLEGVYDSLRDKYGDVHASDVTPNTPVVPAAPQTRPKIIK